MRLYVGEGAIEQTLGAVDGELLDDVHILAAAVIALSRIAFGIFVGEKRAGGVEHGLGDDVLRGDQFDLVLLALMFLLDRSINFGIGLRKRLGEKARIPAPQRASHHSSSSLEIPQAREGPARSSRRGLMSLPQI